MKTAVIITGHMRSFDRCLPTQIWQVLRHFGDLSFYVSTIRDEDSEKAKLIEIHFPDSEFLFSEMDKQPDLYPIAGWTPGRCFSHEPYAISVSPQAVMAQLWQLEQGYNLFLRSTKDKEQPEVIIRMRPDLYFHSFRFEGGYNQLNDCHVPWWGSFGGVNDRFAIMSRSIAPNYFMTWSRSQKLMDDGCPLHPESLLKASLVSAGVNVKQDLMAEFSCLRNDGTARPPEISIIDLAHLIAK